MVNIEVKVLSTETIKPSSPTPSHHKTFKLSSLDQISPLSYTPIIFYYPLIDSNQVKEISSRLKEALSETLSIFFPLAGRVRDHLYVDCNDEGALYSEALVDFHLSEFLKEPELDLLDKFLPCSQFCSVPAEEAVQVAIQLNVFNSGGIAIGMCFLHKMVDAATMAAFLQYWAAATAGGHRPVQPDYVVASQRYPPREELPSEGPLLFKQSWLIKTGKGVSRRFVFSSTSISALQDKLTNREKGISHPSRILSVAGFIWKSATAAARTALDPHHRKSSVVGFAVNMRPRMVPPVSESCFGNLIWQALAAYKAPALGKETNELHDSVSLLKGAIEKVSNIESSANGDDGFLGLSKLREEMMELFGEEEVDAYVFSSWLKFGFYDLDFGWGKPIWVSNTGGSFPVFANYALLIESRFGDGIEAWMCLDERIMGVLECDPEFLEFASINPSIIIT